MVFHFIILLVLISLIVLVFCLVEKLFLQRFLSSHQVQRFSFLSILQLLQLFYELRFCSIYSCFSSSSQYIFPIFVGWISREWQKSRSFDVFSRSWFYRIMCHLYLLTSTVNLPLASIFTGLTFWWVHIMIILSKSVL